MVMNSEPLQELERQKGLTIVIIVVYFASFCALVCCGFHRKVPINYILLFVFTACVSWIVGFACAEEDAKTVVEAALLTTGVVLALTLYACTTKTDFTYCGGFLFVLGMTFSIFGLLIFAWGFEMRLLYCALGVLLFSFYLIYDTQIIVGGKHRTYQMSEDDYILGALVLYLDIINMFLYILEIMGGGKK